MFVNVINGDNNDADDDDDSKAIEPIRSQNVSFHSFYCIKSTTYP